MVDVIRQPNDWSHSWDCRCGARLRATSSDVQYGEVVFNAFDYGPSEYYVECPLCHSRVVLKPNTLPDSIRKGRE